ncbi:virulence factor TspB C-terminal domain-related protein [Moraxella bovis]|uniref:virulence factor TspB C-terminal domain-related protein n=1 Tax=Moraxella bovis TaxID=476 RepID=UPI002227746C|nr:virulence factor TspB C-terminal domain-related protein [Moraxella bovis]UYZ91018.1 hypothetical protein LP103_07285 [Moraxella bovis]UYZ91031.1 hypothetical protein LP103_07350 [Moraxella bovis]
MSQNKSAPAIAFAILSLLLLTAPAHATTATIPKPIGGVKPSNPAGLGIQIAVGALMKGIGWIMDEGIKTEKIPDPTSGSGSTTGTGTGTIAGSVAGTISTPSQAQTYPFEYWFDGEKFSSAESACQYAFSGYLSKNKLKKSRRPDGTYLEKTDVYIGSSGYYHPSTPGYFTCSTYAAGVNDTSCGKSNICGSHYSWSGRMVYSGTEKTTTTNVSDDYKERRQKARQAVEQAINQAIQNALPKPVPDDQPLPDKKPLPDTKPTPVPVPVPDDLPTVAPNDPAKPETKPETQPDTKPTPVPVPVPDDLPTVAPNDPVKPETKPETKPDTKPDTKPTPVPVPVPNPETQPQPKPVPVPSPNPNPETQPKPKPVPSPNPETQPKPKPTNPQDRPLPPEVNPIGTENPSSNSKEKPNEQPKDEAKPFELPAFCDWAKHVCDFIDWVKTDPPTPETPAYPKIKEIDKDYDINPNLYNANGQCPPPIQVNIGMGTIAIPYDSLCLFFTKNSPLIVAIAYLIGAFIIIGKK